MGLDYVELVMEFEEEFHITIPDAVAGDFATPGDVADWLVAQLSERKLSRTEGCHSQRMFHQLRSGLIEQFAVPRSQIRLESKVEDLLPDPDRRHGWSRFAREHYLDRPTWRWFRQRFVPQGTTVTDLVHQAVRHEPSCLLDADGKVDRGAVLAKVISITAKQMGLALSDVTERSRFVQDLRMG